MEQPKILILEFGSQVTMLIERTLRERGYRSAILPSEKAYDWLTENQVKGIILSGSWASATDEDAPAPPAWILELKIPVLGICYGMQKIVQMLGGELGQSDEKKEYGEVHATFCPHLLFEDIPSGVVWASHGDSVLRLPSGFESIASSPDNEFLAMSNREQKKLGVLFHPEMVETVSGGKILENFAKICGCEKDWAPTDFIEEMLEGVAKELGKNGKAVMGISGGVDSTTLGAILSKKFGNRIFPFCIDTGSLRAGELEEIKNNFRLAQIPFNVIDASHLFLPVIQQYLDAEQKRKVFSGIYARVALDTAKKFGTDKFIQASIAPDFIETGLRNGALIKTHHNVGVPGFHPFRSLFKYEVRAISRVYGLPPEITERQPFPGPGLFVRAVGIPANEAILEIIRQADVLVAGITKESGDYDKMSQLVVAYLGVLMVGVKGDTRCYKPPIAVRAILTSDYMTGIGYQIPHDVRREISRRVAKNTEVSRVLYDEGDKPPATTEFE